MTVMADDILPEEPNGAVVQWMDPGPLRFGSREIPFATLAAFGAGIAVGVGAVLLLQYAVPRREVLPPWRWRRGSIH